MKILQVISSFPPAYSYGGPARVAYEISKELVKRGHEVTVYTTDVYDACSRFKYDNNPMWMDGIEVYYFKNVSNKLAQRKNLATAPMMAFALNKNVEKFDVIHLHEYRSFQAIFVSHYAKKYNIPCILQVHGAVQPIFQRQGLKKIFDLFFGYKILRDASKVIALTETEAEQYKKMGVDEDEIEIVPNGIDLSEYNDLPERGEFRKKYGIKGEEKIILYLGRIHEIKGIDLLVEAFADLVKELDNIKLVIVGQDDGFLSTLKRQIEDLNLGDKILLTGPLYEQDKLKAYVDADVYVLPSVYETFPVTVLEACACGTPVIVTDRCGIADIVDGRIGYVVEYDKDQLRGAIIKVLSDEGLRKRFGEKGRKLIEEKFTWEKIIEQSEKIYEEVIES